MLYRMGLAAVDLRILQKEGLRRLLLLPPIMLGVLSLLFLKACKNDPEKNPEIERARTVRFIEAPVVAVIPHAIGYGTAQPGKVWKGVAEVSGKIVGVHSHRRMVMPGVGFFHPGGRNAHSLEAKTHRYRAGHLLAVSRGNDINTIRRWEIGSRYGGSLLRTATQSQ